MFSPCSYLIYLRSSVIYKYLVPEGYPERPKSGEIIEVGYIGDAILYYSSVVEKEGSLFTQSSRTLAFVGIGDTLDEAEKIAESAAASIRGAVRYRKDIGTSEVLNRRIAHMKEIL